VALVLVDAKKRPKPKPKPPTKGECKNKGPTPSPKIFKKYTKEPDKCRCWWDIERTDCACCKEGKDIQQCGYPMHNYCYKKDKKKPVGCPGVCNNEFTLSTKGFPCYSDHGNTDCAWCTDKGFQCEDNKVTGVNSKEGSRCANGKNKNYCKSQQGDCKHIPACDVNAECKFKKKLSRYLSYWQCECREPFPKGNGIKCKDANGTFSTPPNMGVEVTLSLTQEEYTYPYNNGELGVGEKMEALNQEMNEVAGAVCDGDSCNATFNQTVQEN